MEKLLEPPGHQEVFHTYNPARPVNCQELTPCMTYHNPARPVNCQESTPVHENIPNDINAGSYLVIIACKNDRIKQEIENILEMTGNKDKIKVYIASDLLRLDLKAILNPGG
jgi:hypothetical protein